MADRSGTEITEYHSYMYAESQGTRYVTSLDEFTATYCTAQYYYSITTVDSVLLLHLTLALFQRQI